VPRREPEDADEETVGQCLENRRLWRAELLLNELAAAFVAPVLDLHAARIVEQHRDHVLLVDGGPYDEGWPEETEQHQPERGDAQTRQDDPVTGPPLVDPDTAVREGRSSRDQPDDNRNDKRCRGDIEAEVALLEHDRAVGEQRLKKGLEHPERSRSYLKRQEPAN
jgi:hypothetical protein